MKKASNAFVLLALFLYIFQPPFLPVPLIYLLGPVVLFYLYSKRGHNLASIIRSSRIESIAKLFLLMTLYLLFVNSIDLILFSEKDLFSTRLRCFNQILFLSFFQFGFVAYLLFLYKKHDFSLQDSMSLLVKAGVAQGFCAVLAFLIPPIRQLFVMFGDQELFTNDYFLETRGYGFSMTLIDTFGYGMGLIGGYILLFKWSNMKKWEMITALLLIMFTVAVNARTGILVLLIAAAIRAIYSTSISKFLMKVIPISIVLYALYLVLPGLLKMGVESENQTISWICFSFSSMFDLMQESNVSSGDIENLDFLSSFINLPSNIFELFFGSGHYVYDTQDTLGFRTDIGYFNLFWEFGIFGSFIILGAMFLFMIRPFLMTEDISIKRISLFNTITYFMLLIKAILIGYNPGVFVNYLVTFSLYYYIAKSKQEKRINIKKEIDEQQATIHCNSSLQC